MVASFVMNLAGTFEATGQSSVITPNADFNISLSGFGTATIALERSDDGGSTWHTVETFTGDFEGVVAEIANGVQYRLNCTAHTDDITYRLYR